jgi:NodT family efflux transporter outer membrane factor (OMF) lipoprotein
MKKALFLALPSLTLLCACTVGPDFVAPTAKVPDSYAAPGDSPLNGVRLVPGAPPDGVWWKQFHLPALDALVTSALQDNPSIAAAQARLAQATEDRTAAEAALLPQLNLLGQAGSQNYAISQRSPLNVTLPPFEYIAAGPSVSFPLDLFGGGKRAAERADAFAQYQQHQLDAATLSLLANLTAQAIRNAAARAQIDNLQNVVAGDQRDVDLVQSALDAGSATRTQFLSVQSQLASDRTLLPDFRQQEAVSRHALAVLAGKAPGGWSPPTFSLADFALPAEIPASLPSELIHHRPDILAAEAQLHMASAAIGVATANLYPQFNLSAQLALEALTPASLAKDVITEWGAAANVTEPLLDGGKLGAQQRAAIDAYQASLAEYQQTVLAAFREVADHLQALANDTDRIHAESEAAQTAAAALDLARRSFEAGNSGVLDVIDAERRSAEAQLGLSRATAQRLLDTVQLYVALGGTPIPMQAGPAPQPGTACCSY